jgi:hypothetical protein
MIIDNKTLSKLFKILYKTNLIIIGVSIILFMLNGSKAQEDPGGAILYFLFLGFIFIIAPLLVPFLLLNIWGAFKYKEYRVRYIIISVILIPLIFLGLLNWDIPFP